MSRYRLYVDESGDHTYNKVDSWQKRYLCLTGVVVKTTDYRQRFHPLLEGLKQDIFPHSPDEPIVLVRNEIVYRTGEFGRLRDPDLNSRWESGLLKFLSNELTKVFSVVIDKKAHRERYGSAAFHPYHYCMTVLMERYRGWLGVIGGRGDIMAESRGGVEDMELKAVHRGIMERGTPFLSAQQMQDVLASRELKVKKKHQNIAGLQVSDLLAYPAKIDILLRNNRIDRQGRFTELINNLLNTKYNQHGRTFLQ